MSNRSAAIFFIFVFYMQTCLAVPSIKLHSDLPYISKKGQRLLVNFQYSNDSTFSGSLKLEIYKYQSKDDSSLILCKLNIPVKYKIGVNKIQIDCSSKDSNTFYSAQYYEILTRTGNAAPGCYKTIISVVDTFTHSKYKDVTLQQIDSLLASGSLLRRDVNKILSPTSIIGSYNSLEKVKAYSSGLAISNRERKIEKKAKVRGFTIISFKRSQKSYIDYYYEEWFAGRYEVFDKKPLQKQLLQQRKMQDAENPSDLVDNDLDMPSSLGSQYKRIKKQKDESQEVKGQVAVSITAADGQEQYANFDNNYYEVSGHFEIPVKNLPVELDGFYSSQDQHRPIKSSYFRVHYDVEKIKSELAKFITSYNQKFSETESKLAGIQQVYKSGISNLEEQRAILIDQVAAKEQNAEHEKTNKTDVNPNDGTATVTNRVKEESLEAGAKLEEKRKKIEWLTQKIDTYKLLLSQFSNNRYFDSALNYSKTKSLNYQEMSYKQMLKKSSNILPEGSAKKFVNGISSADAGMFPKYASKYTMSGQMMKGIDFSYDLGFAEVGATVGKTEYVGRDGSLDKYTCYSTKTSYKILDNQKVSLVYYGYSADKSLFAGTGFYKNINISTPTFTQPVHIFSADYDGVISKIITVDAEIATSIYGTSIREGRVELPKAGDKTAYHVMADGGIPNTKVQLGLAYDKTGKSFVNTTLPLSLAGTEQYRLGCSNDFFRSFLSVAIDYNYLAQGNLASRSSNTKWGFDIKTHSKRYPSLSVSYKPFTTFHSYTDTFNIPSHPLFGSVLTGKSSFQFKQGGHSWRFSAIYNRCTTSMDTIVNGNTLVQVGCTYSEKEFSASANTGMMKQYGSGNGIIQTSPSDMEFLGISINYKLDKNVIVSAGQDMGVAVYGFCKYSANGGLQIDFKKLPVTARMGLRFSTFQLTIQESWKQIYSGNIEIIYRFKVKHNNMS